MNTEQEKKFHDWYYSEKRLHGYCYSGMVWEACLNSVAEDKLLRELNMRDFKVFHRDSLWQKKVARFMKQMERRK